MSDILDRPCNSLTIKNALIPLIGKRIKIKCNLGRNKYEKYEAKIINVYNSVFLVDTGKIVKSFSFADIITKIIKIYH